MVNFYVYDITFLVLFTIFVVWFLYTRRKKLEREGILYLYRTQFGIKAINYFSSKYKKTLNVLQYISIACGYLLMVVMLGLFAQLAYIYVSSPQIVRQIKIPPIMPLIPYLPNIFKISFLPPFYFTYWILILAVIAIGHEFSHGIFAKFHKVKIKSTGFGFLGPFLAAFVEPDEKQMNKKSIKAQLAVLSAGTFANIIMTIIFIIIFVLFFWTFFSPAGVMFNSYAYSPVNISQINSVNGNLVTNPNVTVILNNLNFSDPRNFTRISSGNQTYILDNNIFLVNKDNVPQLVYVYDDLPAVNANLEGAVSEINGIKIKSVQALGEELSKYNPGDSIIVTTINESIKNNYNITLANSSDGRAIMGINFLAPSVTGYKAVIYFFINKIRDQNVYYVGILDNSFGEFIYNLLWWMIFLNLSVALVNMLPMGIFDGGRFFYLTVLGITKSKNIAEKAFKAATIILLLVLAIIMIFWGLSFI